MSVPINTDFRIQFIYDAFYRSKIDEVFIYPGSEPDFALVQSIKIDYHLNRNFNVYLAIKNIGNFAYEELERYRMPGRHFLVGFNTNFEDKSSR